jgi:hypothetical protein
MDICSEETVTNNEALSSETLSSEVLPSEVLPSEVVAPTDQPLTIETQFTSLAQDLISIKTLINEMQSKFRLLEKSVAKNNKPPKPEKKVIQPSGFDAPVKISDELCIFMNKPLGSILSRPSVTDYVMNYIRSNKLQDMTKRKKINPNETLYNLLRLKSIDEEVTYFNLQKYLNEHFI